jgi:hypothetical protein
VCLQQRQFVAGDLLARDRGNALKRVNAEDTIPRRPADRRSATVTAKREEFGDTDAKIPTRSIAGSLPTTERGAFVRAS